MSRFGLRVIGVSFRFEDYRFGLTDRPFRIPSFRSEGFRFGSDSVGNRPFRIRFENFRFDSQNSFPFLLFLRLFFTSGLERFITIDGRIFHRIRNSLALLIALALPFMSKIRNS